MAGAPGSFLAWFALADWEGKSRSVLYQDRSCRFGETTNSKLLFVAKLVANSPNGQNHLRVFRVLFDLGSQPVDV
jgi:hypothetical protein